ncbi:MAG: hypothetical protein IJ907_01975 [Prevotella sp.]|nr:hypothetical protein [Prevotella sp.]MBR2096645.1 hypothetical protein [Prevotella sp.]
MERIIKIDGRDVRLKATASTLVRYRNQYGRDLIKDYSELQKAMAQSVLSGEAIDYAVMLTHTMARQADPSIPADPWEWVDEFEVFDIREIIPETMMLWTDSLGVKVEVAEEKKE